MIKTDYYKFDMYDPYKCNGEQHRTLREAKAALLSHISKGHRVGHTIYGCTVKDGSISLSFTHWYDDTHTFGRTTPTNIANAIRQGKYKIQQDN